MRGHGVPFGIVSNQTGSDVRFRRSLGNKSNEGSQTFLNDVSANSEGRDGYGGLIEVRSGV